MNNTLMNAGRRQFLVCAAAVAGGMIVGLRGGLAQAAVSTTPDLALWLRIDLDGAITVCLPTPEIGNGAHTQGALIIAEELGCDLERVSTVFASPRTNYLKNSQYMLTGPTSGFVGGRSTLPARIEGLLQIGASARERLKMAAAQRWQVDVAQVSAAHSVLTCRTDGRALHYGEVALAAAAINLAAEPAPKPQSEWTLIGGRSSGKLTNQAVVAGRAVFGIDVRPPGMVYAALRQSPVHGGKLKAYDAAAIKDMPGVLAVVEIDPAKSPPITKDLPPAPAGYGMSALRAGVAVIAKHYWQAKKALDALPVTWDDGSGAEIAKSSEHIHELIMAGIDSTDGMKVEKLVGTPGADGPNAKRVEATYYTPFCDQAPIEPINGTCLVTPDRVELWHPAQNSHHAFLIAGHEAGMPRDKVEVRQTFVGGAFGRRVFGDDVRTVVAVAKQFPGRPVQVVWSREEMFSQGMYRSAIGARMTARLDPKTGQPNSIVVKEARHGVFTSRITDADWYANVPYVKAEAKDMGWPIRFGAYRGPNYNSYAYMVESFIDECAHAAGIDPYTYRLALLQGQDEGWLKSLVAVAKAADWGKATPRRGYGEGIAVSSWNLNVAGLGRDGRPGTPVAVIAKVEVSRQGELKLLSLDAAFDSGRIMNADAVAAQMEGAMIFGINGALNEEIEFENGRVVSENFDTYPMMRMADAPRRIDISLDGLTGREWFSEVGEGAVGPAAAAVGNAIFAATGKRLRREPFRKSDLSWT